ncbi:hypothetical protein Emed_002556 [Eimeria media]
MTGSRLFFATAAALSVLRSGAAEEAPSKTTVNISLTDAKACLSNMNEARQAADLKILTEAKLFPEFSEADSSSSFCYTLLGKEAPPNVTLKAFTGTPAVFKLEEENNPPCSAAEKTTTPDPVAPVQKAEKKDPEVNDGVVEDDDEDEDDKDAASPEGGSGGNDGTVGKKASALVCLTSPDARTKNPLYTEQQWDKIAKALSNPASSAVPSFLILAAALAAASSL